MKNKPAPSDVSYDQLLQKAEHFCAWRERCVWEVEEKLRTLGAGAGLRQRVIDQLTSDGFLNEQRFALSFVRGKVRNNHWGRIRIIRELQYRQIPNPVIDQALGQLDAEEYGQILEMVAGKKAATLKDPDPYTRNGKIAAHCMQKGFEPDLVWHLLNKKYNQ